MVPGLLHTSFYDGLGLFEHILPDFEISGLLHPPIPPLSLPKVHMPVGLHILLKHVPDYQDIIDFGVGQTSEEGLEHLHKIIKDALRRHTNTSSLKSAHLSLMRYLLLASSPKLAAKYPQFQKLSHRKIDDDLAELLIINQ